MTPLDLEELKRLAEAATKGPWDRMAGRGLVRAIRDDLAVPLFEPLEPYADPLLEAPTCRVAGEVVFRANSQAARESAAIKQSVHNAAYIAAANPETILSLISTIERQAEEIAALRNVVDAAEGRVADYRTVAINQGWNWNLCDAYGREEYQKHRGEHVDACALNAAERRAYISHAKTKEGT